MASHGYVVGAVEHKDQSACLTFNRVPGPGVPDGEYDRYVNEWVPYLNKPKFEFPLRNRQVRRYLFFFIFFNNSFLGAAT